MILNNVTNYFCLNFLYFMRNWSSHVAWRFIKISAIHWKWEKENL